MLEGFKSWITQESARPVQQLCPDASDYLIEAYDEQSKIGWNHFARGRWSDKWAALYNEAIKNNTTTKVTAESWGCSIIQQIWEGIILIWIRRNTLIYGKKSFLEQSKEKEKLLVSAQTILERNPRKFRGLHINEFRNKNNKWITAWIQAHQEIQGEGSENNTNILDIAVSP
jgi:hypothetical protein